MMELPNNLCTKCDEISLYYAMQKDKRLIYDMSKEEQEIFESMFHGECELHTWEEYQAKENEFYTGNPGKNNYLLVVYDSQIIGSVSYSYNDAKIPNMEMDIFMRATRHTGKGLGTKTLILIADFLHKTYNIKTFIIRPSIRNARAIRCYQKSGFEVMDKFNSLEYYGNDVGDWGDGDYGLEGTVNMVKVY